MISDLLLKSKFEILLQSIHHTVITLANPRCLLLEKEIKPKLKLLAKNKGVKDINFVSFADPMSVCRMPASPLLLEPFYLFMERQ